MEKYEEKSLFEMWWGVQTLLGAFFGGNDSEVVIGTIFCR
jgi:hypothetical protein